MAHVHPIKGLIDQFNVSSLLDYGSGKARAYDHVELSLPNGKKLNGVRDYWGVSDISFYDPGYDEYSELPTSTFDCVILPTSWSTVQEKTWNGSSTKFLDLAESLFFARLHFSQRIRVYRMEKCSRYGEKHWLVGGSI